MSVWLVVWVVLMMLWLFGSGWTTYQAGSPNWHAFGAGTLIPWACVLILGLFLFGAIH